MPEHRRTASRAVAGLVTVLVVLAGLVAPTAASATPPPQEPDTVVDHPGWGRTTAPDQVLRSGCRAYRLRYRVSPPGSEWLAEIFVVDRAGRGLASRTYQSSTDPARSGVRFTLCRASVDHGRIRIRMRVTSYVDGEAYGGRVRTSRFRLTRSR